MRRTAKASASSPDCRQPIPRTRPQGGEALIERGRLGAIMDARRRGFLSDDWLCFAGLVPILADFLGVIDWMSGAS